MIKETVSSDNPSFELHWYAFAFHFMNDERTKTGSCYIGLAEQRVTIPNITHAKQVAEMPENAVLMGLFYLGKMTKNEVTKGFTS